MSQASLPIHPTSIGGLLTAERVTAWSGVLLIAECLTLLFFIAGTHGWIVPLPGPVSSDYVSFYAAGTLAAAGTPSLAYDTAAHYTAEQAAAAPGIAYFYFFYPPVFLLLCRLFAALPYLASYIVFQLVTGAAWLLGLRQVLRVSGSAWLLPCIAFPAAFWNIGLGQNAFLTASLFAFATCFVDRRPWLAGVLFGALCYKPHFGLLVPIALIAGRRWRTIAGAAIGVLGLVLVSGAIFGWQTWLSFLHQFAASRGTFEAGKVTFAHIVTPFGAARLAGASVSLAYTLQIVASLCASACVGLLWWRCCRPGPRNAALLAGTLLSVPVALPYDLLNAFVAAAWLVRDAMEQGDASRHAPLLTLLFLTPLFSLGLGRALHLQLAPCALATLLILCLQRGLEVPLAPRLEAPSTVSTSP